MEFSGFIDSCPSSRRNAEKGIRMEANLGKLVGRKYQRVQEVWEERKGRGNCRGNSQRQNVTFYIFPKVGCNPVSGFSCLVKERGLSFFHYLLLPDGLRLAEIGPDSSV